LGVCDESIWHMLRFIHSTRDILEPESLLQRSTDFVVTL